MALNPLRYISQNGKIRQYATALTGGIGSSGANYLIGLNAAGFVDDSFINLIASQIPSLSGGIITGTNVQAALDELSAALSSVTVPSFTATVGAVTIPANTVVTVDSNNGNTLIPFDPIVHGNPPSGFILSTGISDGTVQVYTRGLLPVDASALPAIPGYMYNIGIGASAGKVIDGFSTPVLWYAGVATNTTSVYYDPIISDTSNLAEAFCSAATMNPGDLVYYTGTLTSTIADVDVADSALSGGLPTKKAHAMAVSPSSVGQSVILALNGPIAGIFSGMTPGAEYYTGTAGATTLTPPDTNGLEQFIGVATGTNSFELAIDRIGVVV